MLLPQEIAEQLTPEEVMDLEEKVITQWDQAFSVIKVTRSAGSVVVVVELDDRTRHEVRINSSKNKI